MELGLYSFAENTPDVLNGNHLQSPAERLKDLLEEIELADQLGLDFYGLGEHHRPDFVASSPVTILAAAAARTRNIRLSTAVTVLSSDDPIRVFQRFSTLDALSHGRAEVILGRGSFTESFPLFGLSLEDYEVLFAEKLQLLVALLEEKPVSWQDLTKPIYKGQIVMPNPASSGTGYFDVTAWLTLFGDKDGKGGGWKYMDALHENIAQYTHSGSKPCNMAASGEFLAGISFEYRGNTNKAKGAPIELVFPKEGLGWDLEAFAIHKGTKKLDAAKKLADWASSKDAMLLYGKNFAITAQPGVAAPLANVPKDYEARLVKMDFSAVAESRERVLAEWTRRYNSKSEKR